MSYVGPLLGPCSSLTVDYDGNVYYFIPKSGAVVRWNIHDHLTTAEYHDVLYQGDLDITQIIIGLRSAAWLISKNLIRNTSRHSLMIKI